ncbi:MAG TPA: hypothetical protein VN702_14560, partial [Acetobacteraceae bacterium]|nr:hypothetical protein [Acetobacteraceae bacterium]
MRLSIVFSALFILASTAHAATSASTAPELFAPDTIPAGADDGAAAFAPDGATVYFMRATGDGSTLMESRRRDGR